MRRIEQGPGHNMGMTPAPAASPRASWLSCSACVGIAQIPQGPGAIPAAADTPDMVDESREGSASEACAESADGPPLFEVGARRSELSEVEQDMPQRIVSPREAHGVLPALGQAEDLLRQLPGLAAAPPARHTSPATLLSTANELCRLPHLLAERIGPG